MVVCDLDLGADPWGRLAEGRVAGTIAWGGGSPLPVTVAIRGAHSRRFPKRSLQVTLRGPFLPDAPPEGHMVRRIHLNADYIDPTLMRSRLSFALFDALGVPAPHCQHVALHVSGEYAGLYVALESVDADFLRRRSWEPGPVYYAVNRNANFGLVSPFTRTMKGSLDTGYQPVAKADTGPLRRMLTDINLASERAFPRVAVRWVDVSGYLRWLAVAVFVGNRDGFVHNYALYFDPAAHQFHIIPWDYDATWGIDINGKPARLDRVPLTGWNKLTHRLMDVPGFREEYRRILLSALDGPCSPQAVSARIDRIQWAIAPWTDNIRQDAGDFEAGIRALVRWAEERGALLRNQLRGL